MDLTQHFSDDQTALIGCGLALLASGGLMWASYFVGQAWRRERHAAAEPAPSVRLAAAVAPHAAERRDTARRRAA